MEEPFFLEEVGENGVARITLTRSHVHNAFNDQLIAELTRSLNGLESDERVRVVVLAAQGKSFSAGADLAWMKRMAAYDAGENLEDARALAELMRTLNDLAKPTLALVQGPAFGGGVGLIACCDIAIAAETVSLALTEVRLGLIPAVISPYVVAKIGESAARRYFLTAERMTAAEALGLGLVHQVVPDEQLEARGVRVVETLLAGGPKAQAASKDLISVVAGRARDAALIEETARRIAEVRVDEEGREGIAAFLEKRKPNWTQD
jgi:methylglutaconyl-CoA hydratase